MKQAVQKVKGGKLLRVKVDDLGRVELTGDFFAHPESAIKDIEEHLSGLEEHFNVDSAVDGLQTLIEAKNYKLIGIDAEAIITTLQEALK